jgi:hypothetical protein
MSLLIFSKLFTRRRLQREQEAARAILERSEGSGLAACTRKASVCSEMYKYQQYRLTEPSFKK